MINFKDIMKTSLPVSLHRNMRKYRKFESQHTQIDR